jgi:geranylgeranyl reductase family protein
MRPCPLQEELPATRWDAVVIGAGPAGCSAARCIARSGFRVLILERRREVGLPVHCAEYIPLAAEARPGPQSIAQRVEGMRTFIEGRMAAESRWPGMLLNRALFEQELARGAVGDGAVLLTRSRVESVAGETVAFGHVGGLIRLRGRIVIGADGPRSITGRALGLANRRFVHGLQRDVALAAPMDHVEVHFRPEYVGGYGWVFPKGGRANVGLGVVRSAARDLPRLLEAFLGELQGRGVVGENGRGAMTGGLIPAGGPPRQTVAGSVVLVGDAAGQTDPITGGGIPAALACGKAAGEAAARALEADAPHWVSRYEEQWRDAIGFSLERALGRRRTMEAEWNRVSFERLIRRTWIAFPEYYREP